MHRPIVVGFGSWLMCRLYCSGWVPEEQGRIVGWRLGSGSGVVVILSWLVG